MKKTKQVPERTFKEIVYIAGSKYEITDENIYKYYKKASYLVKDRNKIIGFRKIPSEQTS